MNDNLVVIVAGVVAAAALVYVVVDLVRLVLRIRSRSSSETLTIELERRDGQSIQVPLNPADVQSIHAFLRAGREFGAGDTQPTRS